MSLCSAIVLLTLVATALADGASKCDEMDVTGLKDTLRQSACILAQGGNATEAEAFKSYVQAKHGEHNQPPFFTFAELFHLSTTKVWCRSICLDPPPEPENITWCVNIAYRDRDVETCIRPGTYQPVITNSTCEAELVDVPNFLSLPSDCEYYGDVGCLGLTNLDWFFQAAYLTCTVETDDCYSKSFTELLTYAGVSQHPEFEVFPTSPVNILFTDQMVLHAELTTTTDRITAFWEHDGIKYTSFIFEDPFCDKNYEECRNDTHPDAPALKQNRIRAYRTTRVIRLDGCETTLIYRLESYLIIDNVEGGDGGQYSFNLTATHSGYTPANAARSVNVTISCDQQTEAADCSSNSLSIAKNESDQFHCKMAASPANNFSLYINKTTVIRPREEGDMNCRKYPEVLFSVAEEELHFCFSHYNFTVIICAADQNVVGEFHIFNENTGHLATGTIEVKLIQEPKVQAKDPGESSSGPEAVVYAVPLAVLVVSLIAIVITLVLLLRGRKRRRRVVAHLHSPSLKEAAFFKEDGPHSPVSPGNCSFGDQLEFPRNRLYIYSNKVLGEGSFGRVLQAKAEGIVPGMPNRNIVAIKTTKENATSIEREELMAELQLMRSMDPHENILNLLGYCTSPGGPLCLIVEFATYGNLRDFLRQCEEVVLSLNHMPHIPRNSRSRTRTFSASSCGSAQPLLSRQDSVFTPSNGHTHFIFPSPPTSNHLSSGSTGSGDIKMTAHHPDATALPLAHSVAPIGHDYINTKGLVYMEDVHNFALQVACGLQHLAMMQIVHCDLAARNVLIAEGFVLKIADFGLARDISGQELYKKNPRGKIPVKWTAPEALENRVFTVKSDVWSYGVLLWELFTYGHTPYPEVHLGPSYDGFLSYLKEGNRMAQPDSCPQSFYDLMRECWHLDPSHRPSPHDIVTQLTPNDSIFDDDPELNEGEHSSKASNSTGQQSSQE